jgi:uncharacterized protein YndB with AHSA1/START domain
MSERSTQHGTFVIERSLNASPARVFAAWATAAAKARWFSGPGGWRELIRELDFRAGGRERVKGAWPEGMVSDFQSYYLDIVPDERIIYSYDMHIDEKRISISLATVELRPEGAGTRMTVTEQGIFLDGYDDQTGARENGTKGLLDRLAATLEDEPGGGN